MRNLLIHICLALLIIVSGCKKDKISGGLTPNDFLSNSKYDKLIVEIQYVEGFPPTPAAVDNLKAFLVRYLNKQSGITIVQSSIKPPGKSSYTVDDIRNIENANRTQNTDGKTIAAYFFFADNDYAANSGSSKVLGIAYGNSSMVIFEKTIREFSGGITQPSVEAVETTVINHEFAHILGLVNNGTAMQASHQDSSNGKHCNNANCLMYHNAETSDVVANLIGVIPSLDANCAQDLYKNGGK